MAARTDQRSGPVAFLADALQPLGSRRLLLPALGLLILLTVSNIVILLNAPARGQMPPPAFLAAAFVRVFGLLLVAVAILRLVNRSLRPAWRPDGAFWLYVVTFLFQVGLTIAVAVSSRLLVGRDFVTELILDALVSVLLLPLAPWFTAIAVERPLAWRPGRWLRCWSRWLPHLAVWMMAITIPLGALHAVIDDRLARDAGPWFWPLALFDGPLSVLLLLSGAALASEAYRRVARS